MGQEAVAPDPELGAEALQLRDDAGADDGEALGEEAVHRGQGESDHLPPPLSKTWQCATNAHGCANGAVFQTHLNGKAEINS